MDLALVIFDNDGVLVDSEPHAHPVLVDLLNEYGYEIDVEASVAEFLGTTLGHVRQTVEQRLGRDLPSDFEDRYHRDLFASYERGLEPVEGVEQVIRQLEVPYCVASSGAAERICRSLDLAGLWGFFEGRAFSAEEVARGKPHPDLFLHAATRMNVSPKRCVVIEDSPLGVEAANRAGMSSVGFAARTPAERLEQASEGIISRMADLPPLLASASSSRRAS